MNNILPVNRDADVASVTKKLMYDLEEITKQLKAMKAYADASKQPELPQAQMLQARVAEVQAALDAIVPRDTPVESEHILFSADVAQTPELFHEMEEKGVGTPKWRVQQVWQQMQARPKVAHKYLPVLEELLQKHELSHTDVGLDPAALDDLLQQGANIRAACKAGAASDDCYNN